MPESLKKWITSLLLLPSAVYLLLHRGDYTILDNADLVIHEAGHVFFMIFGRFIYMAGGTLMQIMLPSLIVYYFFHNYYLTGVQIAGFWLGQNMINISVYAADAQRMRLHLLGNGLHDWHYMLSTLGMLSYTDLIGWLIFGFAIVVFGIVLGLPRLMERFTNYEVVISTL